MFVVTLKLLSQILLVVAGIMSLRWESYKPAPTGRRLTRVGWVTVASLTTGFLLFVVTDVTERRKNAQKDAIQKEQIANLELLNQRLKRLSLDRPLSGVEISFKPSADHWSRIAEAYQKIKSPQTIISYADAPMTAERVGNSWKINFEEVSRPEGIIRFTPVSTDQPGSKEFESVIRQAAIGLSIKWDDGVETTFQPERNEYPSAIAVSRDRVALTLRHPAITLNLNSLSDNPTVTLRGEADYPISLRFRSLDPTVTFDQDVDLSWKEESNNTYIGRALPYISGPYRLDVTFKTVSP